MSSFAAFRRVAELLSRAMAPALLLWIAGAGPLWGQGTREDYERAAALRERTENTVFHDRVEARWLEGGSRFWYRNRTGPEAWETVLVDAGRAERGPAFDHARLAEALSAAGAGEVDATRIDVTGLEPEEGSDRLVLRIGEKAWRWDPEAGAVEEAAVPEARPEEEPRPEQRRRRGPRAESAPAGVRSPDGKWEVFLGGDNLHLRDTASGESRVVTRDGNPGHTYRRDPTGEAAVTLDGPGREEEAAQPEVFWSPDNRFFAAMRTRPGVQRRVYLVESSPDDQLQPKLDSYPYLKPGDEIPLRKPRLFEAATGREIPLDDSLFSHPWSITDLRWSGDGESLTFLYNQRGHQALRVIEVRTADGACRAIIDEGSPTFIDYAHKSFYHPVGEGAEILWMSERDGWNHLYLYDAASGAVRNQVTQGPWVVRRVERVDEEQRQVWFWAGGIRPEEDPYHLHLCRVDFDGTNLAVLTEGDGAHAVQFSPDNRFFIDSWSRVDLPPVHVLRESATGRQVLALEEADVSRLLATGWRMPERFVAKGRDGNTDIHGVLWRPSNFDPARRYPVVESIYAGPHDAFVPKTFRSFYRTQELAELGFVVVQIDGMGTSNRSKAFHDVCWKNLGDSGFPDRILWLRAAAERYAYLDLERVGIYGGSAGGQSALRAVLAHGDFYDAAAADCGCHDNRMDKIWWNELWMGWPVGPHYEEQSNVTQAHRLQGKLLLTVGELDRNVDPSSTLQVVDALIEADKDFELVVLPGKGHGAGETPYGARRRADFFVRSLHGVEPRREPAVP